MLLQQGVSFLQYYIFRPYGTIANIIKYKYDYNLFNNSSLSASYPGLPSKANILRL